MRAEVRVVLASRIAHSHHLARALAEMGILDEYYAPLLVDSNNKAMSWLLRNSKSATSRRIGSSAAITKTTLWGSEAAMQILLRVPRLPTEFARTAGVHLANRALPKAFGGGTIVHYHSPVGAEMAAAWKSNGCYLVCDERGMHVLDALERTPNCGNKLTRRLLSRRVEATLESYELADQIIVTSHLAAQGFVNRGVDRSKVCVLSLGADLPPASVLRKEVRTAGRLRLLFIGRLGRPKGIDLLAEAAKGLEAEVEVTLVGTPDESFEEIRHELPTAFRVLGQLSATELQRVYVQSDVLVLPSRFDSFGLVVVEAMAAGIPVIISDQCGVAEHVTPDCGWVVPAEDSASLKVAIMEAIQMDPATLQLMKESARVRAQSLTWENYRRNAQSLYAELIKNWREKGLVNY